MTITRTAIRPAPRQFRRGWIAIGVAVLALPLLAAGTGIGASTVSPTATVLSTISITDPVALEAAPAPSADATWTGGAIDALNLGDVGPGETGEASVTWSVTTTSPTGYQLVASNASGSAPMLTSGADSIDDFSTTPTDRATLLTASAFGFSAGDRVTHNQGAVDFLGSPWGAAGSTQGELYRDVPVGGTLVAERTAGPQTNDPVTLNFLAVNAVGDEPPAGSYSGTMQITATAA